MAKITLKGTPVHTSGDLPQVGSKAQDFILINDKLSPMNLNDFAGKVKILYTVPSLDTATCSLSTKKFSEALASHPEVAMLVISADLPFAQGRFCGSENIKNIHTLSLMRTKQFATDYGVLITDGPLEGLTARAIIVLGKDDVVLYTELVSEIAQEPNYDKALAAALK
ncbi:MAG: thiol peroxidase [Chlamydiae bacterium]|nr:thiol peroxidase [Chlamydiota bacterium]